MMAKAQIGIRLPNAPLVESVFEMRWALQGSADIPATLHVDPGYLQLQEAFSAKLQRLGFPVQRDVVGPQAFSSGYSIAKRFYPAPDQDFPLLQIGPGIFAANQSADYEWGSFCSQITEGVRVILTSYPKLANFPLTPTYLELRYIDAFDQSLLGTTDIVKFLELGTQMRVTLPEILWNKSVYSDKVSGRIVIQRKLKNLKATQFVLDLGTGSRQGDEIIRLETKVVTKSDGVPKLRKPIVFLNELGKWLQSAHEITSPFFKEFVVSTLMQKFEKKK